MAADRFATRLLRWYDRHGRHDLPWQGSGDPYRVWVSEIMLQQTQAATVIPYYERFIDTFADLGTLADADLDQVLALWSGLGYYSRARNLHRAARYLRDEQGGRFPTDLNGLLALPGVGRSTAGAILALALGECHPILDGNVKRVLCRYHAINGWPGSSTVASRLWPLADDHTPNRRCAEYTQAIMDLGAMVCRRSRPLCQSCPLRKDCQALAAGKVDVYPESKPRAVRPRKSTLLLVIRNRRGELLLERRPPSGIWGGLWSLPECRERSELSDYCVQRWGVEPLVEREGAPFSHSFSHFHLDIQPIYMKLDYRQSGKVMEAGQTVWYKADSLRQLGLPAPIRELLLPSGTT